MNPRAFSAVQPSGHLHIGNYLGALKSWVQIQHDFESFFGIVDLYAITVYQDPVELARKTEEVAALFLASGIDARHSAIFAQSSPAHLELAWVRTCATPVGWLTRMTQYRTKAEQQDSVGSGLLLYPVLMAADILLYQAAVVPVGDDRRAPLTSGGAPSSRPRTRVLLVGAASWNGAHGYAAPAGELCLSGRSPGGKPARSEAFEVELFLAEPQVVGPALTAPPSPRPHPTATATLAVPVFVAATETNGS